ncbi:glycoprotein precursor [Tavallinen suomalainen mies virus]|uniref:Glycoprotein n=1 Tax=tavallinen suomalainen mies virus 2 TaxID=2447930 RepID=A0A1P8PFC5_9VIRU|nr:glycoprotein precursor [Tavallinen suomalainen mies virus]APX61208.1 glycoprotein precursor [Tavallinen suomalainen mies virus]
MAGWIQLPILSILLFMVPQLTLGTIGEMLSLAASGNSSICHGMQFTEPTQSFMGILPNGSRPMFKFSIVHSETVPRVGKTLKISHDMKLFGEEALNYMIFVNKIVFEPSKFHNISGSCRQRGFKACVRVYSDLVNNSRGYPSTKLGFTADELNKTHRTNPNDMGFKICISCRDHNGVRLVVYSKINRTAQLMMCPSELIYSYDFTMNSSSTSTDEVVLPLLNVTGYSCVALHNKNMLTHHSLALSSGSKVDNTLEPGCDSNVGLFGHSTGTDYGWGLANFFSAGITNSLQISQLEHVTDAIACKIAKTSNYTTTALFLLNKEEGEIRDHVIEHEIALNYLLAHQGGLCNIVKGPMCCSDIDDFRRNVSDMIDKVHEEMKKFYHEPDPFGGLGTWGFYGTIFGHILQWIPIIIMVIIVCFVCSWVRR